MPEITVLDTNNKEVFIDVEDFEDINIRGMSINDEELLKTFMKLFTQNDKIDSILFTNMLKFINNNKENLLKIDNFYNNKIQIIQDLTTLIAKDDVEVDKKLKKIIKKYS